MSVTTTNKRVQKSKQKTDSADEKQNVNNPKQSAQKKQADEETTSPAFRLSSVRSGRAEKFSHYEKPMLAHLHGEPFDNPDWVFEIKWDGYRAVAEINKKGNRLYSRNGLSFANLYPKIFEALKKIKDDVTLDGEIVVMNESNKPDFQKLQQYDDNRHLPILYYVFDCLQYKGKDITGLPLLERKKIAEKVIPPNSIIRYSEHVEESGIEFFNKTVDMDLEGMIAKRADSIYLKGRRSHDWLKIKNHNTQEAVIAGYTEPRGSRKYFGALILGIYVDGTLKYIGHTGTGFNEGSLKDMYSKLQPLVVNTSPFNKKIVVNSPVTWVKPELVCAIKFSELTEEGILRHPVFLGLRVDKSAKETDQLDAAVPKKKNEDKKTTSPKENVTINGHKLILTNQQKIYWPDEGITKGDIIGYYNSIHKFILPHLKDRPQSLRRNPGGIKDKGFFQKDASEDTPSWIQTVKLHAQSVNKDIDYIICNDKATLAYLNNLGCIELNPWNSKIKSLDYPDYLVMDIDPSEKNTFDQVIDVALVIKQVLDKAGAVSYCKTSGASGLHVYVPLHAAYTYEQARAFAEVIAMMAQEHLPVTTTLERSLDKRKGRIYIDYLQNKKGQTLASVYSVRPVPGATVSTPLLWSEVKPGLLPSQFTIHNIADRISQKGDLFADVLREKVNLQKCLKNLS
jgi:bifunctional non-homologous end joining protein LigD